MTRSAILIPVPAAEPLVGSWRLAHDPSAALGVPAHVTLLVPWRQPPLAQADLDELRSALSGAPPLALRFDGFGRFPGVLWLRLADEDEALGLMQTVHSAFPECPPYGGAVETPIPHLTIADLRTSDVGHEDVMSGIEEAVAPGLPLRGEANEVSAFVQGEDGRWRLQASFALEGGST